MTSPEPLDADRLRALAGDHAAELTRYTAGMLGGDSESARDVVQDAFIRLWRKPPEDLTSLRAWLYSVCRTRAIDLIRRRGRMVSDDGAICGNTADEAPAPDAALVAGDTAAELFALVDTLKPQHAEVVRLRFRDDLSYAEIASVTGLTETNVGFILHTALKTLRERLRNRPAL